MGRGLLALAYGGLLACSRSQPAPRAEHDAGRASPAVQSVPGEIPGAPPDGGVAPAPRRAEVARLVSRPPAHGCVAQPAVALDGRFERGYAGFVADHPLLVAVEADGRGLALFSLAEPDRPVKRAALALDAPLARAALHCADRCTLVFVDQRARLRATQLDATHFGPPDELARGVDRRFAPAIAHHAGRAVVAYTATVDGSMHTLMIRLATGEAPRDLTPAGHGAAAPTFVLGASPPVLVMIDARAGVSPLLEVALDARGEPTPAVVRTPVSQPSVPPLLAAVAFRTGEIEVFYRLIGRLAMTAIGRVPLRRASEPTPLLPSRGYGELELAVARGEGGALVALEVPTASAPTAPRSLELSLLDGRTTYPALRLGDADTRRPSLARGASPGRFLLAYVRAAELRVQVLTCDEPR